MKISSRRENFYSRAWLILALAFQSTFLHLKFVHTKVSNKILRKQIDKIIIFISKAKCALFLILDAFMMGAK